MGVRERGKRENLNTWQMTMASRVNNKVDVTSKYHRCKNLI